MDNSTVKQLPEHELWFEVFIDYDTSKFGRLVEYLKTFHNVRDGMEENIERCRRAVDELHLGRLLRSEICQAAKQLDPRVRIDRTAEKDVFHLLFRNGDAAMLFKLTYC